MSTEAPKHAWSTAGTWRVGADTMTLSSGVFAGGYDRNTTVPARVTALHPPSKQYLDSTVLGVET